VFGVLLLGTLENGLSVSGVQPYRQQIITGVILVVVMGLDRIRQVGLGAGLRRLRPRSSPT